MIYNPADHYWIVAASTTQVWSSARASYVPVDDATYAAWKASGRVPTFILNAQELFDVLQTQWVPLAQLAGVTVTSSENPALDGTYAIDAAAQGQLTAISTGIAAGKPLPGGGATMKYPDDGNVMHDFTAAEFISFAAAIEGFLYASSQALLANLTGATETYPSQALAIP